MIGLVDYAILPPEINSGRMYAGAGAGPMVAAAAAWDGLAAELNSTASSYQSVLAVLTSGPWVGPSSMAMASGAAPYVSWLAGTATQAEQTAQQLESAVAAYEAAFAATVPPGEIEINRALLASLVATNIFGQNTPAIAATEAQYARMWAQDAAAMYGYAGSSAAATTLAPFTTPPQTTDPANQLTTLPQTATGGTAQSTLAQMAVVPDLLNQLSAGNFPGSDLLLSVLNSAPIQSFEQVAEDTLGVGIFSYGVNFAISGVLLTVAPIAAVGFNPLAASLSAPVAATAASEVDGLGSTLAGSGTGPSVSAGVGEAATVGKLSVPQSWVTSPEIRLAASALPATGIEGSPQAAAAGFSGGMPSFGGPVASVINAPRGGPNRPRTGVSPKVIPAWPGETGSRGAGSDQPAADGDDALSERDELNRLRRAVIEVGRQRDALKRTAAVLIQESKHN